VIRSRLTELGQQAVESLPNSRGRGHSSTRCGRWCPASSPAPLRARSPMRASTRGEVLAAVALRASAVGEDKSGPAFGTIPPHPHRRSDLRPDRGLATRELFSVSGYPVYVVKDLRLWGWCDAYSASSFRKWGLLA